MRGWPGSPTSGTSSASPCGTRPRASRCAPVRPHPPLADGLATLALIRQATGDPAGALEAITEAARPHQVRPACWTRSRPAGGCCWPRATARRGPIRAGQRPRPGRRAGLRARIRAPGAGPGAARPGPARPGPRMLDRLHAAAQPRAGTAASSRSARCGHWRWPPPARRQGRSPPSPGRSCSPARRATYGSSPTRARRWPRCSAG